MTDMAVLDLASDGGLLDPDDSGHTVPLAAVPHVLRRLLAVPTDCTDIVVFVHGWNTSPEAAVEKARRMFAGVRTRLADAPDRYPHLGSYRGYHVAVRWPSEGPYRKIRNLAHAMATTGQAAKVIGHLLGYLNQERRLPEQRADSLANANGQYLHCVGHSFGGRFLGQAIQEAMGPEPPPSLGGWPWRDDRYPYTVDSFVVFQMAAPPDIFSTTFQRLLGEAPINCPIVLTFSSHDRATGRWHRAAERTVAGIGRVGARKPREHITEVRLRPLDEDYARAELCSRIVNVDASWRYRDGPWFAGAHSDFWRPESYHLLLSLFALARNTPLSAGS